MSQSMHIVRNNSLSVAAVAAAAGVCLAVASVSPALAAPTFRVVAKTGDQAPGTTAGFTVFGLPSMSVEGEVAFAASLSSISNASGIWSEGQAGVGNLQLVAREGGAVPGGQQGWTFGEFEFSTFSPTMNASGESAYGARVLGNGLNGGGETGIFRHSGGIVERVALPTAIAPGAGISSFFASITNLPAIGNNGEVTFRAGIEGVGVNASNDVGIWSGAPGATTLKAREGQAVPGLAGATLTQLGGSLPATNGNGDIAFRATIDHNGDSKWSMWRHEGGALSMDVRSGNIVPLGFAWYGNVYSGFYDAAFNDAGETAFWQTLQFGQSTGDGVWKVSSSDDDAVAWEGSGLPGGLEVDSIDSYSPIIDGFGTVTYTASVTGPGVNASNDSGIFRQFANGFTQQVAREGQQAPGLPAGVVFDDLQFTLGVDTNEIGELAFTAFLTGPGVNADNDRSIWVKRSNGALVLIAREGDIVEIEQGQPKQISDLRFRVGKGPESGRRGTFNGLGQMGLRLTFTDDSQAVVVAQLPPTCPGDVNGDGFVNITDLNLVLGNFGLSGNPGLPGDANLDGTVNITDLNLVLGNFGASCNPV